MVSEADESPVGAAAAAPANPRAVTARAPTVAAVMVNLFMILLLGWCEIGASSVVELFPRNRAAGYTT